LIYIDETKRNTVGDVISDDSFPVGVSILNSPTNSGKTYLFKHVLKNPRILIAPTKALVDQIVSGDNNIAKCYDRMPFPVGSSVIVMTYDKVKTFIQEVNNGVRVNKQDYDLYIDEAHNLYSSYNFRYRTMEVVYRSISELYFKKVVLMSGTMRDEFLPNLKIDKKITISRKNEKHQKCSVVKTNSWVKYIRDSLNKDTLTLILLNNKNKGKTLSSLLERDGYKTQLFNADNQKELNNREMLTNEEVKSDVNALIFTSIGVEGLNINNFKINKVFAIGHYPSAVLEQLKNRARKTSPELIILKTLNCDDDGYIRWIDVDKRLASAKRYVDFANLELSSTVDEKRKGLASCLLSSVKSLPSDLQYTVAYNYKARKFFVSKLGLASLLYHVDCSNEEHNNELFELHMKNYNFNISNRTVILAENETKELEKEVIKLREEEKSELISKYNKAMVNPENSTERLRYTAQVINNNGKDPDYGNKIEGIEELEEVSDLIIKSSILSKYYSYEDLQEIIIGYIKDDNVFDMAKDYGEQIRDKAWIRPKLEDEFKLDHWYSIHEVRSKLKLIEELARNDIKADFNGLGSNIAISNYLHRMFSVEKNRITKNGKKVMHYCINSYNPIGKQVITEDYSSGDLLVRSESSPVTSESIDDDYQILKTASL